MRGKTTKPTAHLVRTATPGIYRKDNRYMVVFRDISGRQRKRSAHTLAEAKKLKAALSTDVDRNEYVAEAKISFVDYARRWIETYDGRTARGIRPHTLRDYRRLIGLDANGNPTGRGAVAHFGRTPLAAIRPQDLKEYAAKIAGTGVARNTVRLALAPLKAMLATAHEEGVIRSNPLNSGSVMFGPS